MAGLYIIGNGFDLHHGLMTGYQEFHRYVTQHDPELADTVDSYFELSYNDDYLWKDFENDLGTFDWRLFFDDYNSIDLTSESLERNEAFGLEDELDERGSELVDSLKEIFRDWISDLHFPESILAHKRINLVSAHKYISFNYTDTLERYYGVAESEILYIHGKAEDYRNELIFGHGYQQERDPRLPDLDDQGNSNRTMFTDSEDSARSLFYQFTKDATAVLEANQLFLTI
ncbi:MAG TPA: bacteriophage abortive infection AbiH family protein [Pedobacter sp.]|nr:bacteriophage abortive infection AbiH family protein [Pedobacter sp.]